MSYGYFADYYDSLTENVDYEQKAEYILSLFKKYNYDPKITLDLACGTGTLTLLLKKAGIDIYGIDQSPAMLSVALNKALSMGVGDVLFLNQSMESLDLYGTINTCISTLDSLNHLPSLDALQRAFKSVSFFMEKDGLFIFDVNTEYKHHSVLANNAYVYETDEVYCVWQNETDEKNVTQINLDIFVKQPQKNNEAEMLIREREQFTERAFSVSDIEKCLINADFQIVDILEENSTINPPKADTQRIVFVAKKLTQPKSC